MRDQTTVRERVASKMKRLVRFRCPACGQTGARRANGEIPAHRIPRRLCVREGLPCFCRNYGPEAYDQNPFCEHCEEKDCTVSGDGTCAMIRRYLKAFKDGVHECEYGRDNKCIHCGAEWKPNNRNQFEPEQQEN